MRAKVTDFDYHLPTELIAQKPIKPRDHSRLLFLNKRNKSCEHARFFQIFNYLKPGDILVLNNSKVFPARLLGEKVTGGKVEIFLHQQKGASKWECLVRGRVITGTIIKLSKNLLAILQKKQDNNTWLVSFNLSSQKFLKEIKKIGLIPLPPYIKRNTKQRADRINYQTVFADEKKLGSVAAPTAGLHFTKKLLIKLKNKGIKVRFITLHVGLGTFAPVKNEFIHDHQMHQEFVQIKKTLVQEILEAKKNKNRIIAVGTTSCRALEASAKLYLDKKNNLIKNSDKVLSFWTDIFIFPGHKFRLVDGLVTNFHLPKSTLLMLVSALVDRKSILEVYQLAIKNKYRFFSYGDAMLIW